MSDNKAGKPTRGRWLQPVGSPQDSTSSDNNTASAHKKSNNTTITEDIANIDVGATVVASNVEEPLIFTRREHLASASNIAIISNEFDDFDVIIPPPTAAPETEIHNNQNIERQQKTKRKIIIASIVSLLLSATLGLELYYSGAIEAFVKWLSPVADSEFQGPTMFQGPIYVGTDEEEVEVDPHYVDNVNGYISMIDVNGNLMSYTDSYLTSSPPRSGAGLWYGSASTTDGTWGYFIGHNPGDFNCVLDLVEGDEIIVYDDDGNAYRYFVVLTFDVARYSTWGDVKDRVTGYGESVILQTCIDHTSGYRIVVAQ